MKDSDSNSGTPYNVARHVPGRARNGAREPIWGALLAITLCVPTTVHLRGHLWGTPECAHEGDQAAEQLLQRAANALGGAARLRAIDRLQITAVERQSQRPDSARGRKFKLWLPDRFQSNVEGLVTHTLSGGRLTIDRELSPEMRRNAERSIPGMFRRVALAFLLRAPGLGDPRLHGEATIAGLKGSLLEFTATDGRNPKLLLAPNSAHPMALILPARAMDSTEQLPDQVWRLEDYRVVDGVRFPFRLTIVDPKNEIITEVQEIEVNPSFTPADFPK
jgi:hypothetical protein